MLLSALTPIFLIILLGLLFSRLPLSNPGVWAELERLTYYIFFPALLIIRLGSSNFDWDELAEISKVFGLAILAITFLIVLFRKVIAADSASLSSIYQGSVRFNTYIGLACIETLYGDRGLVLAALCLAVYIPLANVLCVVSLSSGGEGGMLRMSRIINSIASNPLILACIVGITISYTGFNMPQPAESVLEILSQPALPIGLLAVGAGIHFVALGDQSWQLLIAVINKLFIFPAFILLACLLFDTGSRLSMIMLLLSCLPSPPSAYILARQLGGNESLMANIITAQTMAAFFAIPFWIEMGNRYL